MKQILELKPTSIADCYFKNLVHDEVHSRTEYVGCIYKRSIIFRMPKLTEQRDIMSIKIGLAMTIRCITDAKRLDFLVFKSVVKSTISINPKEQLLILDYPQEIQSKRLRTQARLPVELMARMQKTDGTEIISLITDFSAFGCKCEAKFEDEAVDAKIDYAKFCEDLMGETLNFELRLVSLEGTRYQLKAEVRSASPKEKMHIGLKFTDDSLDIVKNIYGMLVMEQQGIDANLER